MKKINELSVQELFSLMQSIVRNNAYLIKDNNDEAEQIRNSILTNSNKQNAINELYHHNFTVTKENNKLLELHNMLLVFVKIILK